MSDFLEFFAAVVVHAEGAMRRWGGRLQVWLRVLDLQWCGILFAAVERQLEVGYNTFFRLA